jgi:hypothetical protein
MILKNVIIKIKNLPPLHPAGLIFLIFIIVFTMLVWVADRQTTLVGNHDISIYGSNTLQTGSKACFKVLVTDLDKKPLKDALVNIDVRSDTQGFFQSARTIGSCLTNDKGFALINFDTPEKTGQRDAVFSVSSKQGHDRIAHRINFIQKWQSNISVFTSLEGDYPVLNIYGTIGEPFNNRPLKNSLLKISAKEGKNILFDHKVISTDSNGFFNISILPDIDFTENSIKNYLLNIPIINIEIKYQEFTDTYNIKAPFNWGNFNFTARITGAFGFENSVNLNREILELTAFYQTGRAAENTEITLSLHDHPGIYKGITGKKGNISFNLPKEVIQKSAQGLTIFARDKFNNRGSKLIFPRRENKTLCFALFPACSTPRLKEKNIFNILTFYSDGTPAIAKVKFSNQNVTTDDSGRGIIQITPILESEKFDFTVIDDFGNSANFSRIVISRRRKLSFYCPKDSSGLSENKLEPPVPTGKRHFFRGEKIPFYIESNRPLKDLYLLISKDDQPVAGFPVNKNYFFIDSGHLGLSGHVKASLFQPGFSETESEYNMFFCQEKEKYDFDIPKAVNSPDQRFSISTSNNKKIPFSGFTYINNNDNNNESEKIKPPFPFTPKLINEFSFDQTRRKLSDYNALFSQVMAKTDSFSIIDALIWREKALKNANTSRGSALEKKLEKPAEVNYRYSKNRYFSYLLTLSIFFASFTGLILIITITAILLYFFKQKKRKKAKNYKIPFFVKKGAAISFFYTLEYIFLFFTFKSGQISFFWLFMFLIFFFKLSRNVFKSAQEENSFTPVIISLGFLSLFQVYLYGSIIFLSYFKGTALLGPAGPVFRVLILITIPLFPMALAVLSDTVHKNSKNSFKTTISGLVCFFILIFLLFSNNSFFINYWSQTDTAAPLLSNITHTGDSKLKNSKILNARPVIWSDIVKMDSENFFGGLGYPDVTDTYAYFINIISHKMENIRKELVITPSFPVKADIPLYLECARHDRISLPVILSNSGKTSLNISLNTRFLDFSGEQIDKQNIVLSIPPKSRKNYFIPLDTRKPGLLRIKNTISALEYKNQEFTSTLKITWADKKIILNASGTGTLENLSFKSLDTNRSDSLFFDLTIFNSPDFLARAMSGQKIFVRPAQNHGSSDYSFIKYRVLVFLKELLKDHIKKLDYIKNTDNNNISSPVFRLFSSGNSKFIKIINELTEKAGQEHFKNSGAHYYTAAAAALAFHIDSAIIKEPLIQINKTFNDLIPKINTDFSQVYSKADLFRYEELVQINLLKSIFQLKHSFFNQNDYNNLFSMFISNIDQFKSPVTLVLGLALDALVNAHTAHETNTESDLSDLTRKSLTKLKNMGVSLNQSSYLNRDTLPNVLSPFLDINSKTLKTALFLFKSPYNIFKKECLQYITAQKNLFNKWTKTALTPLNYMIYVSLFQYANALNPMQESVLGKPDKIKKIKIRLTANNAPIIADLSLPFSHSAPAQAVFPVSVRPSNQDIYLSLTSESNIPESPGPNSGKALFFYSLKIFDIKNSPADMDHEVKIIDQKNIHTDFNGLKTAKINLKNFSNSNKYDSDNSFISNRMNSCFIIALPQTFRPVKISIFDKTENLYNLKETFAHYLLNIQDLRHDDKIEIKYYTLSEESGNIRVYQHYDY